MQASAALSYKKRDCVPLRIPRRGPSPPGADLGLTAAWPSTVSNAASSLFPAWTTVTEPFSAPSRNRNPHRARGQGRRRSRRRRQSRRRCYGGVYVFYMQLTRNIRVMREKLQWALSEQGIPFFKLLTVLLAELIRLALHQRPHLLLLFFFRLLGLQLVEPGKQLGFPLAWLGRATRRRTRFPTQPGRTYNSR